MVFRDRRDAGRRLAASLAGYAGRPDVVVIALPRGGLPVAHEVARALNVPLDVFVVRKIGVPHQEELALGAIATGGVVVHNEAIERELGLTAEEVERLATRERAELERRERLYRGDRPPLAIAGKTVLLIDDGLATGATMRAAVRAARRLGPARIVVAVPIAAQSTCRELAREADEVVCVLTPEPFSAVGLWYDDFAQVSDDEVRSVLRAPLAGAHPEARPPDAAPAVRMTEVKIRTNGVVLIGDLAIPPRARGVVLFAHGSGSSRRSPRNRRVAGRLHRRGFATLLLDLIGADEAAEDELTGQFRFDISLLGDRLVAATDWLAKRSNMPIGYFGASTGAAAALVAAARRPLEVKAVVSRGGRPDLAEGRLPRVAAPTLLIVGSRDEAVFELNKQAYAELTSDKQLVVVEGASHLFEEPGALDRVAEIAGAFFEQHLRPRVAARLRSAS
jgi:putative phosphoribosyl transferase